MSVAYGNFSFQIGHRFFIYWLISCSCALCAFYVLLSLLSFHYSGNGALIRWLHVHVNRVDRACCLWSFTLPPPMPNRCQIDPLNVIIFTLLCFAYCHFSFGGFILVATSVGHCPSNRRLQIYKHDKWPTSHYGPIAYHRAHCALISLAKSYPGDYNYDLLVMRFLLLVDILIEWFLIYHFHFRGHHGILS